MTVPSSAQREYLFDRYSKGLEIWNPDFAGLYACPLCLHRFPRSALDPKSEVQLTAEHCILEGLGDDIFVLTCKRCNDRAGHQIDHHLHKLVEMEAFARGQGKPKRIRLKHGDDFVTAEMRRTPERTDLTVLERRSDPRQIAGLQQKGVPKKAGDMTIRFGSRDWPEERRACVAMLKAAYLLAFKNFGYSYILSPSMHEVMLAILQQIMNPEMDVLSVNRLFLRPSYEGLSNMIARIKMPTFQAFFVPIRITKYKQAFAYILPTSESTYPNWVNFVGDQARELQFDHMEWIPFDEANVESILAFETE